MSGRKRGRIIEARIASCPVEGQDWSAGLQKEIISDPYFRVIGM